MKKPYLLSWTLGLILSLAPAHAVPSDSLIDALVKKGVLSEKEAESIREKAATELTTPASSAISFNRAIKHLSLYGDIRLRAEMRDGKYGPGELNANTGTLYPSGGSEGRDRLRYRVRLGLLGELNDNVFFGVGVATNPTGNDNVTFADQGSAGPFGKAKGIIGINKIYLGWRPTDYLTVEAGQFDNPFYGTNLVWDSRYNPTGFAEKFQRDIGDFNVFANGGQFIYQAAPFDDSSVTPGLNYTDTWMLEEQVGFNWKIDKDVDFKLAASITSYTGTRTTNTANKSVVGKTTVTTETETASGSTAPLAISGNSYPPNDFAGPYVGAFSDPYTNNYGINNLLVLDVPGELNFKLWNVPFKVFADVAWNLSAHGRSQAAASAVANGTAVTVGGVSTNLAGGGATATYPTAGTPLNANGIPIADFTSPYLKNLNRNNSNQNMAYEAGFQAGELKKKGDWLAKVYWLDREYYSLDPNLTDSDVFDGRLNLAGVVVQANYNLTDDLTFTLTYGEAGRADSQLATPGIGQNLNIDPVDHYRIVQGDLLWKF